MLSSTRYRRWRDCESKLMSDPMSIWSMDERTGQYPLPRVLWHLLWWVPRHIARLLFCACVCIHGGVRRGLTSWVRTE